MPMFTEKLKHILQQHSTSLQRVSYHSVWAPGNRLFNMLRYVQSVCSCELHRVCCSRMLVLASRGICVAV